MATLHHGMNRSVWVIFLIGTISTICYCVAVLLLTIFPNIFTTAAIAFIAELWGEVGAIYLVTQILPVVTRPLTKDAWEITDHISSFVGAAIVVIGFPIAWGIRQEWPDYWTWQIWRNSFWISTCDVLLTLVSLKISKNASRITPA